MNIEVITHPGGSKENEDTVLIDESSHIYGIFDGASALDGKQYEGKTGAWIASNIAAETCKSTSGNLASRFIAANQAIERAHEKYTVSTFDSVHRFSTTAACVEIKETMINIATTGDSLVLTVNKNGNTKTPIDYQDHDLELMIKWQHLAKKGETSIRQIIHPDVQDLRRKSNISYGTLNGMPEAHNFIRYKSIPLKDISSVIIISDGMLLPKENPRALEDWAQYGELFNESGLDGWYKKVRQIENSDPNLTKYPRYKIHDDASAIAIRLL